MTNNRPASTLERCRDEYLAHLSVERGLAATTENMITLYTCVMNQRDYRWCVKAVEI